MSRTLTLLASGLLPLAAGAAAHDGESHTNESGTSVSAAWTGPAWTPDGRLYVPKSLQRLLGIRTSTVGAGSTIVRLPAKVVPRPDSAGLMQALEPGRIEPAGAWPVPGQQVERNQVLAILRPALSDRDRARRRVELAQIEQRRVIAQVNVDRLRVQIAGEDGKVPPGNIYFEQAESELRGLDEAYRARLDGLDGRRELRAPVAGRLVEIAIAPGQAVESGIRLFVVADAGGRRLEVMHTDPQLAVRLTKASIPSRPQTRLISRGQEPMADRPGWRLWLDAEGAEELWPGQVVDVELSTPADTRCGTGNENAEEIWVHVAPELFERRLLASCEMGPGLAPGERRVTQGAALLSDYQNLAHADR